MAIYVSDGSTFTFVSGSNTWTNTANIYDASTTTIGSLTTTTSGAHVFDIGGYGFASLIAAEDTVLNSVSLRVYQYVSGSSPTNRWNAATVQAYDGATAIGSASTCTLSATTSTNDTFTITGITLAQLESANFKIRFTANKNGTQSATQNVAMLEVTANVTAPVTTVESWGFLTIN